MIKIFDRINWSGRLKNFRTCNSISKILSKNFGEVWSAHQDSHYISANQSFDKNKIINQLTFYEYSIVHDALKKDLFIRPDIKLSKLFNISLSSKRSIFPLKLSIKISLITWLL